MSEPDEILRHDTITYVIGERDGKKVPVPYFVGEMPTAPDSLDAAWAEAEAALPEGWRITNAALDGAGGWYVVANPTPADAMRATGAHGRTFAAALRALAAKLRARPDST